MKTAEVQDAAVRANPRAWMIRHWVSIALVAVALLYGGAVTLVHEDSVSPIDEVVYLDYAYKVWDQGLVHQGEKFGDDVAHLVACENVIPFGNLGQVCGSDEVHYAGLPNAGYTTGAGYTPAYFWTVRIIGDPIHALTGLSEVSSWRLSGVVWLAATVLVLAALLRRSGVGPVATFVLGLLFVGSPYAWWTYTYLSTDVSVVVFGAATLLVAIEVSRGKWSPWWLLPLAVVGPVLKITNLLAFGVVVLYLLLDSLARRRTVDLESNTAGPRSVKRLWVPVIAAVVVAAAVQVLWMRTIPLLAVSGVVVDQGVSAPLTGSELVRLALSGIAGPITHNPFAGITSSPIAAQIVTPLSWVALAAVVGSVMVFHWSSERGPLIWATALASVFALPALGLLMWVLTHSYFPLPARYGAALIPAVLLVAGFMLKNRAAIVIFACYSLVLMAFGVGLAIHVGASY